MNPEVKAKWIAALRSGDYQPGMGALCKRPRVTWSGEYEFCCLGVLCDLAVLDGVEQAQWRGERGDSIHVMMGNLKGMPPPFILEWAGLDRDEARRLAMMNDNGRSHAYIADYIERRFP